MDPRPPEHALVYLDDEERQGLGFPRRTEQSDGIEGTLDKVIGRRGTRSSNTATDPSTAT
jgi:hypothetical protein